MKNSALIGVALVLAVATSAARGQANGSVEAKAQTCAACHGPNGNATDPQYPKLAGQTARYIYLELKDFKEGRRHDPQMEPMAKDLTAEDMLALADHYSKQKPTPTGLLPCRRSLRVVLSIADMWSASKAWRSPNV